MGRVAFWAIFFTNESGHPENYRKFAQTSRPVCVLPFTFFVLTTVLVSGGLVLKLEATDVGLEVVGLLVPGLAPITSLPRIPSAWPRVTASALRTHDWSGFTC
jgi:hypothetical protein